MRIGVLVNVDGVETWFNDYGTQEKIESKYDKIGVNDQVSVEYSERPFTDRTGANRVARDIRSITKKGKVLPEKDLDAFMPESEINKEKLLKDLETISVIVNSWRGVFSGEEKGSAA